MLKGERRGIIIHTEMHTELPSTGSSEDYGGYVWVEAGLQGLNSGLP